MRRGASRRPFLLFQVVLELAAPRGMAQLAQRFRLDLPDALSRDVELAADLFERARAAVFETEAQLKHAPFATGEAFEHALDLLLEELVARGVAQVEEAHATSDVFLSDRHDETEVCLGQVVPRVVALLDELVGETAQRALLVVVLLHELVEVFDEDVTQLLAEHDQLAEPLRPFGRTVDLRVLREDPERESPRGATRGIDEPDGPLGEGPR